MKKYLIKSKIQPDIWETILNEYELMNDIGSELIEAEGGKVISQYIASMEGYTYTTIELSNQPSRLLYRLLSLGIYADVKVIELITKAEFGLIAENLTSNKNNENEKVSNSYASIY